MISRNEIETFKILQIENEATLVIKYKKADVIYQIPISCFFALLFLFLPH